VVDVPQSTLGEVRPWSVCRVTHVEHNLPLVSCSDVGCRRGPLKRIRLSYKLSTLCCHLQLAMQTLQYSDSLKKVLNDQVYSSKTNEEEEEADDCDSEVSQVVEVPESDSEASCDNEDTRTVLNTMSSLGLDDEKCSVDIDSAENPSMIPYAYCPTTHRIRPGPRCGQSPLPWHPSTETHRMSQLRIQGTSIVFDSDNKPKRDGSLLVGHDCIPKTSVCTRCDGPLCNDNLVDTKREFLECVPQYGMVKRRVLQANCPECAQVHVWGPDDDCIHTIYNQRVGGLCIGVLCSLAFCVDVCDFGILCGCVRLWHFVWMCATLAFCVNVCDFGILCGCVRLCHFWHLCDCGMQSSW
jgi:hypothetical protein